MKNNNFRPDYVPDYFKKEWWPLTLVTVSGLIYNVGLLAGPWFEGKMAERLLMILKGEAAFSSMITLALSYVAVIFLVQVMRYIKRFYVRRFANNVNRRMKEIIYAGIVRKSRPELEKEGAGSIMTKAVSDVDDCAEGMRKFTTEVFDTGVALLAYICMLLYYDWKIGLLCLVFPPIAYIIAEKMKVIVQRNGAVFKEKTASLSAATLDRTTNSLTYRVYGCEKERSLEYEECLSEYEKAAVNSEIPVTVMPPLYKIISMAGIMFILVLGAKNVTGTGVSAWTIATFTTYVSCFSKMCVKSSKIAKLFNSVQKARVSWRRIKPFLAEIPENVVAQVQKKDVVCVQKLSFAYPDGTKVLDNISFSAAPGEIIGVTGPVAGGKSTLGKAFLCEYPYEGSILFAGKELNTLPEEIKRGIVQYLGHDPEIMNDTIKNNILMGDDPDINKYLKLVCLDKEVSSMEKGLDTFVGNGGVRLSLGQAQRLALARTLAHKRPVIVLDDPFSALDMNTEKEVFANLKNECKDSVLIIISHRLYLFPEFDKVCWIEKNKFSCSDHKTLLMENSYYAGLYNAQKGGLYEQ